MPEPASPPSSERPFGFFVHHQGRGHARRCRAIIERLAPRPVTVFTADPAPFADVSRAGLELRPLPEHLGQAVPTEGLHAIPTPETLHCAPLGLAALRTGVSTMVDWFHQADPALMIIDVSAEYAQLARICGVPAVMTRMHGDRDDPGHRAAYQASVALLAPFSAALEQPDYPDWARRKTFYTGGLCVDSSHADRRCEARTRLELDPDEPVITVVAGGGGGGTPYAPLTVGARARPNTRWLVIGPTRREGHETDFANLHLRGWVPNPSDYLAASDLVIASAGDNTVHEIARCGRPFLCIPEWRYFNEQLRKSERLAALGACAHWSRWPGTLEEWAQALEQAERCDLATLRSLHDPEAASTAARWLEQLARDLWDSAAPPMPPPR